jgi:hypothetical protein
MLLTRGGGRVLRALGFVRFDFAGLAFGLGALDLLLLEEAAEVLDFGGTDLAFVTRLLFALGAVDFRFFDGAFVVLF